MDEALEIRASGLRSTPVGVVFRPVGVAFQAIGVVFQSMIITN